MFKQILLLNLCTIVYLQAMNMQIITLDENSPYVIQQMEEKQKKNDTLTESCQGSIGDIKESKQEQAKQRLLHERFPIQSFSTIPFMGPRQKYVTCWNGIKMHKVCNWPWGGNQYIGNYKPQATVIGPWLYNNNTYIMVDNKVYNTAQQNPVLDITIERYGQAIAINKAGNRIITQSNTENRATDATIVNLQLLSLNQDQYQIIESKPLCTFNIPKYKGHLPFDAVFFIKNKIFASYITRKCLANNTSYYQPGNGEHTIFDIQGNKQQAIEHIFKPNNYECLLKMLQKYAVAQVDEIAQESKTDYDDIIISACTQSTPLTAEKAAQKLFPQAWATTEDIQLYIDQSFSCEDTIIFKCGILCKSATQWLPLINLINKSLFVYVVTQDFKNFQVLKTINEHGIALSDLSCFDKSHYLQARPLSKTQDFNSYTIDTDGELINTSLVINNDEIKTISFNEVQKKSGDQQIITIKESLIKKLFMRTIAFIGNYWLLIRTIAALETGNLD